MTGRRRRSRSSTTPACRRRSTRWAWRTSRPSRRSSPVIRSFRPLYDGFVASSEPLADRYTDLLANFLPILKRERKRQQALTDISGAIGQDASFATALLQDPRRPARLGRSDRAGDRRSHGRRNRRPVGEHSPRRQSGGRESADHRHVEPIQFAQVALLSGAVGRRRHRDDADQRRRDPLRRHRRRTSISRRSRAPSPRRSTPRRRSIRRAARRSAAWSRRAAAGPAVVLTARSGRRQGGVHLELRFVERRPRLCADAGAVEARRSPRNCRRTSPARCQRRNGGGPLAVSLTGYIVAPQDGLYNFSVVVDAGAQATLTLGEGIDAAPLRRRRAAERAGQVERRRLTPIALPATGVKTTLTLSWQSRAGPRLAADSAASICSRKARSTACATPMCVS